MTPRAAPGFPPSPPGAPGHPTRPPRCWRLPSPHRRRLTEIRRGCASGRFHGSTNCGSVPRATRKLLRRAFYDFREGRHDQIAAQITDLAGGPSSAKPDLPANGECLPGGLGNLRWPSERRPPQPDGRPGCLRELHRRRGRHLAAHVKKKPRGYMNPTSIATCARFRTIGHHFSDTHTLGNRHASVDVEERLPRLVLLPTYLHGLPAGRCSVFCSACKRMDSNPNATSAPWFGCGFSAMGQSGLD